MSIFQVSLRATILPAIGVHKHAASRLSVPTKSMSGIVTFSDGGSLNSVKLARTTGADPTTRMQDRMGWDRASCSGSTARRRNEDCR